MALLRSQTVVLTTATLIFVFFFITLDYLTPVVGLGGRGMVGRRTEIGDVKTNKEVQELGRFSVEEFNRSQRRRRHLEAKGNGDLAFSEVVEAQKQVVSGIKYYLKIAASQNGASKMFDSVIVVKPWVHSKELLNFAPSTN